MRTSTGGSGAEPPPTSDSQTPRIGDVLDSRFRITGVLGSGGMGCVYLAEHVSIRRPLALKLLHREVGELDEVIKRFEREAFAIGRVDHPNCVKVSDFGRLDDGTFYMVLELLDGVLLFDLLAEERRIHWRRALHIGRHVLSALDYAHQAGIVHRDVKPENVILVEEEGDPDFAKILDFGIAKLHSDASSESSTAPLTNDPKLTQEGVAIGTPTYIAPEQAYGLPIDGRADLYSLSVMLYEMIAGTPPFDADEVGSLLRMHVSGEVPRLAVTAPELVVPEPVECLILDGLEKKPEDRISSARVYIERIDEILQHECKASESQGSARLWRLLPGSFRGRPKVPRRALATAVLVIALTSALALALETTGLYTPAREEPYAQVSLGHDQARKRRSIEALVAYEAAVSLEPKLAKNERMRANVEQMLDRESPPEVADAALEFLGILVSVAGDTTAGDQLVDVASSAKSPERRHKALEVAERVGLGDRIDRVSSYSLDLEQGKACQDRKAAVVSLRALGDKRAIPALREARYRPRGGLGKRKVNSNACLRASANEAIRYLQRR